MKIDILASGSGGNCIAIQSGSTTILVDAGIPKTKIERRLLDAGIRPDQIAAIFVTHAHGDHIKGIPLAAKYKIPIYASEGEWKDIPNVPPEERQIVRKRDGQYGMIDLGELHLYPFGTHHDAYEPLGYAIEDDNGNRCCVVLDTGHIDQEMLEMMEGNIYIIEANHDPELVAVSNYPPSVKARVLSDIGHLSNQQAADALARLVRGHGERIYLTHLSKSNNMPELALATVESTLRRKGYDNGKHYFCEVI